MNLDLSFFFFFLPPSFPLDLYLIEHVSPPEPGNWACNLCGAKRKKKKKSLNLSELPLLQVNLYFPLVLGINIVARLCDPIGGGGGSVMKRLCVFLFLGKTGIVV